MSTTRKMPGGKADHTALPKGTGGRALCRWCAMEVPAGRRTFCSAWCVHEWRMRSNPGYLRDQVLLRDKGICAECRVDTIHAHHVLRRARGARKLELLSRWNMTRLNRRSLWDADHILPVAEGGGECDLENIRTLCLKCHRVATQRLRERLRAMREALK
jgi:5-methylcytosine-specific restriction protein A